MSKNFCIIITGPTGVGKTDIVKNISTSLGQPVEIINADVGQFYEPLAIGTAKPEWQKETDPQHLFDYIKEPKNYTAFDYRFDVMLLMNAIWKRNAIPIIVGGSAFYLKSLFFPPQNNKLIADNALYREDREKQMAAQSNQQLWDELYAIDLERAESLHKNDRYRLERALLLWYTTGALPSKQIPDFKPLCNYFMIFLTRERQQLYDRINKRVIEMINAGWIHEVERLKNEWKEFLKRKKLIGYDDIITFLENINKVMSLESSDQNVLIETIQQKTRWYAKRQHTFWNSFKKQLERCSKTCDTQGVIKEINLSNTTLSCGAQMIVRDILNEML